MRIIMLFIFLFTACSHQNTETKTDFFKDYFQKLNDKNEFSGALLYYKDGEQVFSDYLGYSSFNKPYIDELKEKYFFHIGSLSKVITATGILLLIENGQLSLNTKLSTIFPKQKIPSKITISRLLNHTSGLPYENRKGVLTRRDFINSINDLQWTDLTKHRYSNIGYEFLGLVIEKTSNESMLDFINKNIFKKHNIGEIKSVDGKVQDNKVFGLNYKCNKQSTLPVPIEYSMGSGGVVSKVENIASFFIKLNEGEILRPKTLKKMFYDSSGEGYGFGISINKKNKKKVFGHNGSVPGFKSMALFSPAGEYLFAFSNIEQFPIVKVQRDVLATIVGGKAKLPRIIRKKEIKISHNPLLKFVGRYVLDFDENQVVQISFNLENKYFYIKDNKEVSKLLPEANNVFFMCSSSSDNIEFLVEDGKSYLYFNAFGGARLRATKI